MKIHDALKRKNTKKKKKKMGRMFFMHVDYLLKVENKICFGYFFSSITS